MMTKSPFAVGWAKPVLALGVALVTLTAPQASTAQTTLKILETTDVDGYDPFTLMGVSSFRLMGLMFSPLIEMNSHWKPEYRLADSITKQGNVWIVHLNKDTHFARGSRRLDSDVIRYSPVTATDVVATYKTFINPRTDSRDKWFSEELRSKVERMRSLDAHTLEIRFRDGVLPSEWTLTFPVAPRASLQKGFVSRAKDPETGRLDRFVTHPFGAGYYALVSKIGTRTWLLKKNRRLRAADTARIDVIKFRSQPNYESALEDLAVGNNDLPTCVPDVPIEKMTLFETNSYVQKQELTPLRFSFVAFNEARPPLDDVRVRQALSCALDRSQLLGLYQSRGKIVRGPYPYYSPFTCDDCDSTFQSYNPELANRLLDQAGWTLKSGMRWRQNANGQQLSLRLICYAERHSMEAKTSERIKGYWERVGVRTKVMTLGRAEYNHRVFKQRDFDAVLGQWTFSFNASPSSLFHSPRSGSRQGGVLNFIGYANAHVDTLLDKLASVRRDLSLPYHHELYEIISRDAPYAFLYSIDQWAVETLDVRIGAVEQMQFFRRINKWDVITAP